MTHGPECTTASDDTNLLKEGALNVPQAIAFSGLGRSTLYQAMAAGELVYLKHGTRRLIPRAALVALLARGLVRV